jgi:dipeptidase E
MKLVFFSGGDEQDNLSLDKSVLNLIKKKDPLITFIPSCSYLSEYDFRDFVDRYSKFNISKFIHFPVDLHFDQVLLNQVLKSDIIHLDGGNTFYFLNSLRKSGVLKLLKDFVLRGGILTGLSAGAIIMTEDIQMAGYPEFDRDSNDINLKNLKSLGLVDFYFFPHYKNSKRYESSFKKFSRNKLKIIYACPDGAGIIVNEDSIKFVGKCVGFYKGEKIVINT